MRSLPYITSCRLLGDHRRMPGAAPKYLTGGSTMPDLNITFILPSGGARTAEVPDDVPVQDLMTELTSMLKLPTVGPDGRPMAYRMDSKALGRELKEAGNAGGGKHSG